MILNADAADKEFLSSEGINDCDVFIAVTQDDETNVICSLMAKKLGAKKTITIINKEAYFDLMDRNDLDIIISPVQITVSHILKYIRKGLVFNAHKVKKGAAEVIEMNVDDSIKKIIGKRIVDLGLNGSMNIPAICREDKVLMAHGVTEIKEGDHLLIFYKDKSKQFANTDDSQLYDVWRPISVNYMKNDIIALIADYNNPNSLSSKIA